MINLNMSMMIYQPVRQVFDFVSTPENDFQWQAGTLATARLSEGVSNRGTFFRSIGHLMGQRNLNTFEVTDGGTKINISTQVNAINFFQVDQGVLGKKMKEQLKENLAVLKDLLEVKRNLPVAETNSFTNRNMS